VVRHFDHVTIVVRDVEKAKEFFRLLGFDEDKVVTISGEIFSGYMGVGDIEAEHHTLVLTGSSPRLEVQLLKYINPTEAPNTSPPTSLGFNHICFAVEELEKVVETLTAHGFETKNETMTFHDRKLVFLAGPEGITVELAEWIND
jgi:catechol 2,3-dioxygenase-like lactoylglutathione lyase family enzyme